MIRDDNFFTGNLRRLCWGTNITLLSHLSET